MKITIATRAITLNNNNRFAGELNILFFSWDRELGEEYSLACMTFCPNN
ncbi:hypothetical protein Y11_23711 [Yersinia enterocolitica subsp. palearctica Y11]|uniref:Uncharacterized protein n=1 Tax=Yersinia enterocolitica subsp. palearctica serotype O:3 (strain DSM 13030 / CIP 106945 / Y11) TaxID=930944 RepID=A0A0H3NL18_YERE1|nr:hypothetical protein Y11_23711 [Yersinia enterocolitica subsp. palearctica Y11]CCO70180.1 hypothetical protein D322_3323 [Yersinia enterocolitica IP 10393]